MFFCQYRAQCRLTGCAIASLAIPALAQEPIPGPEESPSVVETPEPAIDQNERPADTQEAEPDRPAPDDPPIEDQQQQTSSTDPTADDPHYYQREDLDAQRRMADATDKVAELTRYEIVLIVSCVIYNTAFDDEPHVTQFFYLLRLKDKTNPERVGPIPISDGTIKRDDMSLDLSLVGGQLD